MLLDDSFERGPKSLKATPPSTIVPLALTTQPYFLQEQKIWIETHERNCASMAGNYHISRVIRDILRPSHDPAYW